MNAYELAKYIEDDIQIQEGVADMLRQQADRIKELEDVLSTYEIRDLNNTSRIAELERTLSIMEGGYPEPTIFAKITEFNSLEEAYNRIAELEAKLQLHDAMGKQCQSLMKQVKEITK